MITPEKLVCNPIIYTSVYALLFNRLKKRWIIYALTMETKGFFLF